MSFTKVFTLGRERPPRVNAAGELEDQSPAEEVYTVHWYVEPAENGGHESPAHPVIESVVSETTGEEVTDEEILNHATDVVDAEFNTAVTPY